MQNSVPSDEYLRLRAELKAAHEQFEGIQQLINLHYGDRSDQAIRAEQVTHAIGRLETELTRFDSAPEALRAGA